MSKKLKINKTAIDQSGDATVNSVKPEMSIDQLRIVDATAIEFSPFNYRKLIDKDDLQKLGGDLLLHGIISPLTVRPLGTDKFQLVAGERRLRAALLVGLTTVPVVIKSLSDDEAIEIQLAENLQRENPHPMDEANAIGQMLKLHKTIEEIALRVGKSKQFVYTRIKLLSLILEFQEMFSADVLTIQQAVNIAALEAQAQVQLFDTCGKGWKQNKYFNLGNLDYFLNQFKYDLKSAPFNIKDKKLVPEVGACMDCSFNTATLKSLFPEYAKQAVCSNQSCYRKKCIAHLFQGMSKLLSDEKPEALLFFGEPTEQLEDILQSIPAAADLPRYQYRDIETVEEPVAPDTADYTDDEGEEDSEEYAMALEDYQSELEEYNNNIQSGKYKKGLLVSLKTFEVYWFTLDKSSPDNSVNYTVTAKQVQQAIKEGTVTPELLEAEINRIHQREKRAKEIDTEKVQEKIFDTFYELIHQDDYTLIPNYSDKVAGRLIIYESLHYSNKRNIEDLFHLRDEGETQEQFYNKLAALTDEQVSLMVRWSLLGKSDGKYPTNSTAYFVFQSASEAGVNVEAIENDQLANAVRRWANQLDKIKSLQKKADKLKPVEQTE